MIKCENSNVEISGTRLEVLTDCGLIIRNMYECGANGNDGLLTDLICAVLKDSTESLEIIKALSKPNLPKE